MAKLIIQKIEISDRSIRYQYSPHWPEKMSYNAWHNNLKRIYAVRSQKMFRRQKQKTTKRQRKRSIGKIRQRKRSIGKMSISLLRMLQERPLRRKQTLEQPVHQQQEDKTQDIKMELIEMLRIFLEKKHIPKLIEQTVPDRRKGAIIYSKQTIILSALCIFLFRMASGHKYDQRDHDKDEKYSKANIAKFIDSAEGQVPVIRTIEDFLKTLDENCMNDLMITFFKDLVDSKFFKYHPNIKPGDGFFIAADLVHSHTYHHSHCKCDSGDNSCCYCLKRVFNKGKENETTIWMHCLLVFSVQFFGGLQIPIYCYPIHAHQVRNLENASKEQHKQECETVGLKLILPIIRKAFPKMKITILLDSLYANRPIIQALIKERFGYIIVRKDGSLSSIGEDCDGLAKLPSHQKNHVKEFKSNYKSCRIIERCEWFNRVDLGMNADEDFKTNVLRYKETWIIDGEMKEIYNGEWLVSWKISMENCLSTAAQGRLRWQEEDLFNTVKNRGFSLKHDYSRSPRSCMNWQKLIFFAFGIFELFRLTDTVQTRLPSWSNIAIAEKLLGQLLHRPTEEIFPEQAQPEKIQFRYTFKITVDLAARFYRAMAPPDRK